MLKGNTNEVRDFMLFKKISTFVEMTMDVIPAKAGIYSFGLIHWQ
jgi:hypothetical protein